MFYLLSSQVTVEYKFEDGACIPIRVHTVVISTQHDEKVTLEQLKSDLMEKVIKPVIPAKLMDSRTIFHLNPSGKFIIGGPMVSSRVTLVYAWYSVNKYYCVYCLFASLSKPKM